jgi:hypothetical protein
MKERPARNNVHAPAAIFCNQAPMMATWLAIISRLGLAM